MVKVRVEFGRARKRINPEGEKNGKVELEMKELDLPGCRGKAERGTEQRRQPCKPRVHMTRRDRKSRQRQSLTDGMRMMVLKQRGREDEPSSSIPPRML